MDVPFIGDDGQIATMPDEMIATLVPEAGYLDLEAAARVANIRDEESASQVLADVIADYVQASAIATPVP